MKILFIISSLGSGGAERVLSILANEFVKKYEVNVITLSKGEIFYELNPNVKLRQLNLFNPNGNILKKILNNLKSIITLKKEIQQINPDIVISFMTQTNIKAIIAAKLANKKIIVSERSNYFFLKSKIWIFLRKLVYKITDGLVVQSNFDKEKYKFVKNVKVILNPINVKIIESKKEDIILAVGRLDNNKAFDRLIKIYSKINTSWSLYLIGEGEEKKNLEEMIKELSLQDKVFLLGRKKNIEEFYSKAKIFTLTSRMEGFPNVLAEAMSYGCACIAFDCLTGPSEMIKDGENGFLIEEGNIDEYVKKLQLLIDDENLREKFSKEAMKIRDKLKKEKIIKEWEQMIKEVTCVE